MIIPGILETTFADIYKKVKMVDSVATLIQIDVVDGLVFDELKKIDTIRTNATFEIHLMIQNPTQYLSSKINKVTRAVAQVEQANPNKFIHKSKTFGYKTGLSLNPETPVEKIQPFLEKIHYVQLMTVHPGTQGSSFIPEVIDKIKEFKRKYPNIEVQIDGHMNKKLITQIEHFGVENYVVGSDIFDNITPIQRKIELEKIIN